MPDHVLLVLQKGYLENLIGTWLLVITIVQVNEETLYKRDMLMRHIIATCFKIAQSYDQAVQAYAKASEALFKADRYIHKKKNLELICI